MAAFTTPEIRALIRDVERVGSLIVSDLPKVLGEAQGTAVAGRLGELRTLGLIQSEYVIVCSRTGNAVLRTDDPNKLRKMAPDWMKCACGRPLNEERVDQVIVPTDRATALNDKGRWMTTLATAILPKLGISREQVIIDASPQGTTEALPTGQRARAEGGAGGGGGNEGVGAGGVAAEAETHFHLSPPLGGGGRANPPPPLGGGGVGGGVANTRSNWNLKTRSRS